MVLTAICTKNRREPNSRRVNAFRTSAVRESTACVTLDPLRSYNLLLNKCATRLAVCNVRAECNGLSRGTIDAHAYADCAHILLHRDYRVCAARCNICMMMQLLGVAASISIQP